MTFERAFIDPQIATLLAALPEFPPLTRESLPEQRQAGEMFLKSIDELRANGAFEVSEHHVASFDGTTIRLLVMRPTGAQDVLPALYHIHGGGMVVGDVREGLELFHADALANPFVVVSVEYRLAPEHPHPKPVEDCYAGLVWLASNADELRIDRSRVVVHGGSAGGGLAAGVALLARDRRGPELAGQCLTYPMLDDRNTAGSVEQLATDATWTRAANAVAWECLLGPEVGGAEVSPYAAPSRAKDLTGLPPTFMTLGSADLFRSEDLAYAERLWLAGNDCELHVVSGGLHGFPAFEFLETAKRSNSLRREWLHRRLFPALPSPEQ